MEVYAHSSLEPPLEYNQDQAPFIFDESKFILTFLTLLEVKKILCSFRLLLEVKTGKEIPGVIKIIVPRKVFSKQFCFIRCRRQHLQIVEKRRYSRFAFVENTISNSPKVLRGKFSGSDGLFCCISICKFDSFTNSFATISSLSELYFRFRRFILLVQIKEVIICSYHVTYAFQSESTLYS